MSNGKAKLKYNCVLEGLLHNPGRGALFRTEIHDKPIAQRRTGI